MKVRELRQAANITQGDLGKILGVDRSTVAYWESGASMPRAELIPSLADALGCTIDALFGREPASA